MRIAGLFNTPPGRINQIGLGAASGLLDVFTVHAVPIFRFQGNTVTPDLKEDLPKDAIVIDKDPRFVTSLERLSTEHSNITALSQDIYHSLPAIAEQVRKGEVAPRNLITILHADPIMIPKIPFFFRSIARVIDESAELIISVGQGFTDAEFTARKKLLGKVFKYLESRELTPHRFVLHQTGSVKEQILGSVFGDPFSATYEILYCVLQKEKIRT
ncbi:MAG: hypothetical protein ABIE03_05145 [Patescibacteria group bacterium]|nr:hypothetical protein [Patescibacteria group bacterium]